MQPEPKSQLSRKQQAPLAIYRRTTPKRRLAEMLVADSDSK